MSRKRSRLADYAVYLVVRLLVCVIQTFTWELAGKFAALLAWLAYRVDRRHRLVALENLRHAFPEHHTEAERDALVRATYLHFARLLIEIILTPRKLHLSNWKRHVILPRDRLLVDRLLSGRPLLLLTGHFGNWELAGYILGLLGFPPHAVARPLDNPYLDAFLRRFREHTGQRLLAKHGDFDRMQEVLASGGVLATLADQDAGQRGLFVDFFNRPASTHKAIALLALEYQVPILVCGAARVAEPLCYRIEIEEELLPEDFAGRPDAVRALTQRFTAALERLVRRYPEQYFWLHNRWKHQPTSKIRKGQRAA
jgi:KDO2-lipid IV(A) lauroyltransferase